MINPNDFDVTGNFEDTISDTQSLLEQAEDGVTMLSGIIALGTLAWSAKNRRDQVNDATARGHWDEYEKPASQQVVSTFFINDKLALDELFSRRIHSQGEGKGLKIVLTCLHQAIRAGAENKRQLIALMAATFILRDYKSIAYAVQCCKRGTRSVIAEACLILRKERDMDIPPTNQAEKLLELVPSMYGNLAKLLD